MKFDLHSFKNNKHKKTMLLLWMVFFIGIVMVIVSNGTKDLSKNSVEDKPETTKTEGVDVLTYSESMEEKLEKEFARIDGVGKVEVVLTAKTKGEIVLNKDIPTSTSITTENDGDGGTRENQESEQQVATVLIQNSDGSEDPIVLKEILPELSGVLIIAEGGDDINIKNKLIQAAKVLLDLPAHKIEVMKMVSH